jgi:hypothetical protein
MPSLFGWLDNIPFWHDLSYPVKSAWLRAFKSGLSVAVGILLAAATQGILLPATWSPLVILVVTMLLQSVDKYLRENSIANAAAASDAAVGPTVTSTKKT